MQEADLDDVLEIERSWAPTPWTRSQFCNEWNVPFSQSLVLCGPSDGIAGYRVRWLVAGEIHLLSLAIAPAERRQGLGGALLDDLIDEARREGAELITLEVAAANAPAVALYASRGFEAVRTRPAYYGANRDGLVMEWRP